MASVFNGAESHSSSISALEVRRILWDVLPPRLPGKIESITEPKFGRPYARVKVLVEISYPNGERMRSVYCPTIDNLMHGDLVIFDWVQTNKFERDKQHQPDLIQVSTARKATLEEIEAAQKQFNENKARVLLRHLQQESYELERRQAELDAEVATKVKLETAKLESRELDIQNREKGINDQKQALHARESKLEDEIESRVDDQTKEKVEQERRRLQQDYDDLIEEDARESVIAERKRDQRDHAHDQEDQSRGVEVNLANGVLHIRKG